MALYCSPEYQTNVPLGGTILLPVLLFEHQLDTSDEGLGKLAFQFRRRGSKYMFKMATTAAILEFQSASDGFTDLV